MRLIIKYLIIILSIFTCVIPNSFQIFTLLLFTLTAIIILISQKRIITNIIYYWLVISSIFIIYIVLSNISYDSKFELFIKYVISPLFWIIIFSYLKKNYERKDIIKYLILISFFCNLSVLVLYNLYLSGYIDIVSYFIAEPNVDNYYKIGFTLHVYGTLIFFALSITCVLYFINNIIYKLIYLIIFILSALISGRTALLLFLFLGIIIYFILEYRKNIKYNSLLFFILINCILYGYNMYDKNNTESFSLIDYIIDEHLGKIKESGGEDRRIQTSSILNQFYENPLGSGFVILEFTRNDIKKYQYEVLVLATLMRIGLFGFLIIIISVYMNIFRFILNRRVYLNYENLFFILGYIAIIYSCFTNPYLESFCFQWMYFAPIVILRDTKNIS